MMDPTKKSLKGTHVPQSDHTVNIPSRISDVEDVVWMSKGKKLTFVHEKDFELEFVASPVAAGTKKFGPGRKVELVLKDVATHAVCKYTIRAGGVEHDPIVIIDPN
jgi:hypothetical protein